MASGAAIRFYIPIYLTEVDGGQHQPFFGPWERTLEKANEFTEIHGAKLLCVFLLMLRPNNTFYFSRVYLPGEDTKLKEIG